MGSCSTDFSLRRGAWTVVFIMVSTGCGGGCACGPACSWDPEFNCSLEGWSVPTDAQLPDSTVPDGTPGDGIDGELDGTTGPSCPGVGTPCRSSCEIPEAFCLLESAFANTLGGSNDPILDHPDGEDTSVPQVIFADGYCTTSYPQDGITAMQCDARRDDGVDPLCGECGKCVDLFGLVEEADPDEFVPGFCGVRCTPSMTSNDCRPGYRCWADIEICLFGCQNDDTCRIAREETNGVPELQTPYECIDVPESCRPVDCDDAEPANPDACADPSTNYDRLVYDTESDAVCDPVTASCIGPHDPVAVAGDPCTEDGQCERWGRCITEEDDHWIGGSCTKERCDLEGNECAPGGVCARATHEGFDEPACFTACTVGGHDASAPESWVMAGAAQAECRNGYGCHWTGSDTSGACLPIRYSPDVSEPAIGQGCSIDDDCWSPFGLGVCLQDEAFPGGYCSVRNCAAPWLTEGDAPPSLCGESARCVPFDLTDPMLALCVRECADADDCDEGLGCQPVTAGVRGCWPGCTADEDCRTGELCSMAGTSDAACVPE